MSAAEPTPEHVSFWDKHQVLLSIAGALLVSLVSLFVGAAINKGFDRAQYLESIANGAYRMEIIDGGNLRIWSSVSDAPIPVSVAVTPRFDVPVSALVENPGDTIGKTAAPYKGFSVVSVGDGFSILIPGVYRDVCERTSENEGRCNDFGVAEYSVEFFFSRHNGYFVDQVAF